MVVGFWRFSWLGPQLEGNDIYVYILLYDYHPVFVCT